MDVKEINCPSRKMSVPVIVRAAGDEPVKLNIVNIEGHVAELVGADPRNTIGFPIELIYTYDEALFRQIADAYAAGNTTQLQKHWGQAIRYECRSR